MACNSNTNFTTTVLATPIGVAVAGPDDAPLVFVANAEEDTIQMLRIPQFISDTNFVRGPARYFPLRIQVGAHPTKLAPSDPDPTLFNSFGEQTGGVEYVVVLDMAINAEGAPIPSMAELSLVNAIQQIPQFRPVGGVGQERQERVRFAFADSGSIAADMVGSPIPCAQLPSGTAACKGRYYVAMEEEGTVLAIDLVPPRDGTPANNILPNVPWFAIAASYTVGGYPHKLAISPDGAYLFVADAAEAKVTRVGLSASNQGAIEQRDIGGIPGPLAVSADNTTLLVGRPLQRDIIVMDGANTSSWAIFDANGIYAPQPRCLFACTGDDTSCEGAYDSDRELCVDITGLHATSDPAYPAIYMENVPALITTLGRSRNNNQLLYDCRDVDLDVNNDGRLSTSESDRNSTISIGYDEYAMVITEGDRLTGNVVWLPLKARQGGPLAPLVANNACARTSIDVSASFTETGAVFNGALDPLYQIGRYLGPCPTAPERNRFSCFNDPSGGSFVILPGNTPVTNNSFDGAIQHQATFNFRWEGILQGLDRSNGGGELVDMGTTASVTTETTTLDIPVTDTLTDVGLDYSAFERIKPQDILQILSTPTTDPTCTAYLAAQGQSSAVCGFERRVRDVYPLPGGTPAIVFDGPRIPVSCFLNQGRIAYRVRAGHQFLVDRNNGPAWRIGLDEQFGPGGQAGQTEPVMFRFRDDLVDIAPDVSACNRYDVQGRVINEQATAFPTLLDSGAAAPNSCDGYVNGSIPPQEVDCGAILRAEAEDPSAPRDPESPFCNGWCQTGILNRQVGFAFTVFDPYRPYIGGRAYGTTGTATTAQDSIPGDVVVYQDPTGQRNSRMFMTFSGANTMIVLDPTNAQNATTSVQDVQIILRN